ncbi:MAG: putative universal stress protein [Nitrospira sp.]|nr:MAG: putative universal stress protein [Nitrospira sp.]
MLYAPFKLRSVFHPTDFSPASEVAFAHALKLALDAKAELRIMHIDQATSQWSKFPQVRETLVRWGLLPPGSAKTAVGTLGLRVEKVQHRGDDPVTPLLRHLERKPADLVVLATHQRHGVAHWMHGAIAEPIARQSGAMTLFVPPSSTSFVSLENGRVTLRHIVMPVSHVPQPQSVVHSVCGLSQLVNASDVSCLVLHVGTNDGMPTLSLPRDSGWNWTESVQQGDIVEQILKRAKERSADLIAMATHGHKGFLDALRGSTTERVVREARCPVLAIPASS